MTTTVTDVQQPDRGRYRQTQRLELTPEEIMAWQSCMKSSSVIMPGLLGAAIAYGALRISPFQAQAKYAAIVGGLFGLIAGRITISQMCLSKIVSANSSLRDRLIEAGYYGNRSMREGQHQGFQPLNVQSEIQSSEEPSTGIVFNDYPSMNTHDTYSSFNNSSDFQITEETDLPVPNLQKDVSYDELRHKNRDEFYKKSQQWYTPRTPERPLLASETNQRAPTASSTPPMQEKTKYGDVWG